MKTKSPSHINKVIFILTLVTVSVLVSPRVQACFSLNQAISTAIINASTFKDNNGRDWDLGECHDVVEFFFKAEETHANMVGPLTEDDPDTCGLRYPPLNMEKPDLTFMFHGPGYLTYDILASRFLVECGSEAVTYISNGYSWPAQPQTLDAAYIPGQVAPYDGQTLKGDPYSLINGDSSDLESSPLIGSKKVTSDDVWTVRINKTTYNNHKLELIESAAVLINNTQKVFDPDSGSVDPIDPKISKDDIQTAKDDSNPLDTNLMDSASTLTDQSHFEATTESNLNTIDPNLTLDDILIQSSPTKKLNNKLSSLWEQTEIFSGETQPIFGPKQDSFTLPDIQKDLWALSLGLDPRAKANSSNSIDEGLRVRLTLPEFVKINANLTVKFSKIRGQAMVVDQNQNLRYVNGTPKQNTVSFGINQVGHKVVGIGIRFLYKDQNGIEKEFTQFFRPTTPYEVIGGQTTFFDIALDR